MNVTPNLQRKPVGPVLDAHDTLVFALRNIARHVEIAASGNAHTKALAFVDIEYEVRHALIAVGEPP
ncbi:MAG: hypothetical protein ACXU89_22670 [Xanthobacteraceae bacterium]